MQGALGFEGSTLSQGLLLVGLIMSIYYVIYAHSKFKLPKYFIALNLLLAIFTIYGLIDIIIGERIVMLNYEGEFFREVSNSDYLKNVYISLLPIYAFFVFGKKGILNETTIQIWSCVFIPIVIFLYFSDYRRQLMLALEAGSAQIEFTNNVSYMFLSLIPALVFFFKKPFVQYLLLTICLAFILMSMKRGAILIAFVCFFVFVRESYSTSKNKKKWIFAIIAVLVFMCFLANELLETSDYFNERLSETKEGNSSARDFLYTRLINYFLYSANPIQFLFGSGADATLKVVGQYAHNDWIEIAVNQGAFGVVVYSYYWLYFYKSFKSIKRKEPIYNALRLLFIIYFLMTFFSMSYNNMHTFSTLVLGYCLSIFKQRKLDAQVCKTKIDIK